MFFYFLLSPCYLQDAMPCQWSSSDLTQVLRIWEHFLLSGVFYLTLLPASFKASLGGGSSTSRLAGLPADLWNIAPAWLFVWITTTYKRGIDSRFVYGLWLVGYVKNLLLTGFELSSRQAKHARSLVFYPFGHRATVYVS